MDVKSQLYSYYIDLLNEISSISKSDSFTLPNPDFSDIKVTDLIIQIKESTKLLIDKKINQVTLLIFIN